MIANSGDQQHTLFPPLSCAFPSSKVNRRWRLVAQYLMQTFVIVKNKILSQTISRFQHVQIVLQINLFVLYRPPQAFEENVVGRSPSPVHADVDALSLQPPRELLAGEP